jgi:hypothetical protein
MVDVKNFHPLNLNKKNDFGKQDAGQNRFAQTI